MRGLNDRGEKPPRTSGNLLRLTAFFMKFRGPKAHPNRGEKPPRGVGSELGDRQDWQRISGKMRRKSMPVLSVPGALVGGDEVSMAVFHELSRAEGPSQQTGLTANFRQNAPEIHASLVSPCAASPACRPAPCCAARHPGTRRSPASPRSIPAAGPSGRTSQSPPPGAGNR